MATYGISTFGKPIVIDEGGDAHPLRVVFAILTFCIGFGNVCLVTWYFKQSNKQIHFKYVTRQSPWTIFSAYVLHTFVHTFHYIDNILRPVAYFEPKYLYQRYLLSTMEVTFFFNVPLTIAGIALMKTLCRQGFLEHGYLAAYICSSLMTLMHYRIEPPASYTAIVNASIAGEGLAIGLFLAAAFLIKQQPVTKKMVYYKLLILAFVAAIIGILLLVNSGALIALFALSLFGAIMVKSAEVTQ
ncbi:hypothetical protein BC940DRAFT_335164 [Gongronella butleri]|nr:hypothetical protein BC940DRAFT_335164 [Gongronella butleri]